MITMSNIVRLDGTCINYFLHFYRLKHQSNAYIFSQFLVNLMIQNH